MNPQVTIKDIARLCNTSVSTVSRVLNGHPDVSEPLRARVLEAAEKAGYVANGSLRNKPKANTIAVIQRGEGNLFFPQLLQSLLPSIYKRQYSCLLYQIATDGDEIRAATTLARKERLLGILFLGGRFNYTKEELAPLSLPFVCCTYTNAFGCLDAGDYSSVTIDDSQAASRAVHALYKQGHRRIAALIHEEADHSIGELRYRGYKAALREHGLPLDTGLVECAHGYDLPRAYRAAERLIQRRRDFTALFAISDTMGLAAMKALQDAGLQVPADCSVMAIDGLEVSRYVTPTLMTLEQPVATLGEEAVRILVDRIEGRAGNRHLVVGTRLRAGASVRRVSPED